MRKLGFMFGYRVEMLLSQCTVADKVNNDVSTHRYFRMSREKAKMAKNKQTV